MTTAKAPLEAQIATIQADLDQAEQTEHLADLDKVDRAAKVVLDETTPQEAAEAVLRWQDAHAQTMALRGAVSLLKDRQYAQEAQNEQDRIIALREESNSSHAASQAAVARLSTLAKQMREAVSDVDAEAAVMAKVHGDLSAASPGQAAQLEQDYLQATTRASDRHRFTLGEVRGIAAGARYTIGRLPAGAQVGTALPLDHETEVPVGSLVEDASAIIAAWELRSVEQADQDRVTALREAYEQYVLDVHDAGMGWLPTPHRVIREALGDVALRLVPDSVREDLSLLSEFLPSSSASGVSVRTIHRDPFEANRQARRFEAGIAALRMLTR